MRILDQTVGKAYAVPGEVDAILSLRLRDMEEFHSLCDRLFRDQTNVSRFFTMMVIRTVKDQTAIEL